MRLRVALLLGALLAMPLAASRGASAAEAQGVANSPTSNGGSKTTDTPTERVQRIAPLLPRLSFSGNTKGEGSLKLELDAVVAVSANFDVAVSPTFSAASVGGVSTVADSGKVKNGKYSDSLSRPLQAGLTLSLLYFSTDRHINHAQYRTARLQASGFAFDACFPGVAQIARRKVPDRLVDEARAVATRVAVAAVETTKPDLFRFLHNVSVEHCLQTDEPPPTACTYCKVLAPKQGEATRDDSKAEAERRRGCVASVFLMKRRARAAHMAKLREAAGALGRDDFCEAGRKRFVSVAREARAAVPNFAFSVGAKWGEKAYNYLRLSAGQVAADGSSNDLVRDEAIRSSTTGGFYLAARTSTSDVWPSFLFELSGTLERSHEEGKTLRWCERRGLVGGNGFSIAEQCKDIANGPPARSDGGALSLQLGAIDAHSDRWRASLGFEVGHRDDATSLGLAFPVAFRLAKAPVELAGEYKGVVRITPRVTWEQNPAGGWIPRFLLTIDLLGDRSLIGRALDL